MRASVTHRLYAAAEAGRRVPGVERLLYAARARADRALVARQLPPLCVALDGGGTLAGYLRHRRFLDALSQMRRTGRGTFHLELFLEAIRSGTTVVDGGAHIGLFTIPAAQKAAPTGKVYAFEADPYNFDALRANVARNHLTNVRLANEALADTSGNLTFFSNSGTIAGSLISKSYVADVTPITITATTVDSEVPRDRARDLVVKLDVEGAEKRVLQGAAETLRACTRGRIVFEQNLTALDDAGASGQQLVALLRSFGFARICFVDEERRELVPIGDNPPAIKGDLVADKGLTAEADSG